MKDMSSKIIDSGHEDSHLIFLGNMKISKWKSNLVYLVILSWFLQGRNQPKKLRTNTFQQYLINSPYMEFTILNSKSYIKQINSISDRKCLLESVIKVKHLVLKIHLKRKALCSSFHTTAKFGTLAVSINLSCQIELSIEEYS